jgi:prepilin-type N-terminal cleavage/methylation domain-containing protein
LGPRRGGVLLASSSVVPPRARGFTLLEVAVVVVIVSVLAAAAFSTMRSASRNASVSSAAFELTVWLDGLRAVAMRDQRDLVAVVVDAAAGGACASGDDRSCGRFALLQPAPGFTLNGTNPGARAYPSATVIDDEQLARGLRFHFTALTSVGPPPYDGIRPFEADVLGTCAGRRCVAIRFRGDGSVGPEWPTGAPGPTKAGMALVLGSDLTGNTAGADQRSVLVTFPSGIVKTFSVSR